MDISALAGQSTAANNSATTLAKDFDNFLNLLTTQLQYQDPLAPMDSNQFTQQLVAFTGVEQSIATNQNLESIIAQNQSLSATNTVGYLGKEVTISSDKAGVREDGSVRWEYALAAPSSSTKITVKDANGIMVHEENGELSAGLHEFSWTPKEGTPKEIYTLEVESISGNEEKIETNIYSKGIVESLETVNGQVLLAANGLLTSPINVLSVKDVLNQEPLPEENGTE
tara:strand:+ start:7621 stop:8301 length:681 start_codon:yes stop_codon:yes gene_type:complete